MSHPGGNRARFFAQGPQSTEVSGTNTANHKTDASFSSAFSRTTSSSESSTNSDSISASLVPFSQRNSHLDGPISPRPALDCSDDEIVAQRTRTTETETLYKARANKERNGKLNIAGLIRHKDSMSIEAAPQNATIQEISDHEELEAHSPRQYSTHKLITKPNTPSLFAEPYSIPPSNQLSSSKMPSSRQSLGTGSLDPDSAFNKNEPPSAARSHSVHSHTSTPISNEDKIKGLTTAFNRKHSSKPAPRFASPLSAFHNVDRSRASSAEANLEDPAKRAAENPNLLVPRRSRKERQVLKQSVEEDELSKTSCRIIERPGVVSTETHIYHDQHDQRGEKRVGSSEVEDMYAGAHAGKRARTEAYDDISSPEDHPISSEPESGANRQNAPPDTVFHADSASRHFSAGDPQLKFIGQDVDEYIARNMERYEAAKKRWSECSREEWEKGADELVEKFTQVLDFVKDNIKRKVNLYATLQTRIEDHQKAREETAEMLKEAKRKLVAKTGVVVEDGPAAFHL